MSLMSSVSREARRGPAAVPGIQAWVEQDDLLREVSQRIAEAAPAAADSESDELPVLTTDISEFEVEFATHMESIGASSADSPTFERLRERFFSDLCRKKFPTACAQAASSVQSLLSETYRKSKESFSDRELAELELERIRLTAASAKYEREACLGGFHESCWTALNHARDGGNLEALMAKLLSFCTRGIHVYCGYAGSTRPGPESALPGELDRVFDLSTLGCEGGLVSSCWNLIREHWGPAATDPRAQFAYRVTVDRCLQGIDRGYNIGCTPAGRFAMRFGDLATARDHWRLGCDQQDSASCELLVEHADRLGLERREVRERFSRACKPPLAVNQEFCAKENPVHKETEG